MAFTAKYKLKAENKNLTEQVSSVNDKNADLHKQIQTLNKEVTKLKTMVRKQTEADLLVNALKGLGIIPAPSNYNAFEEQQRLGSLQRAAACGQSGLVGALSGYQGLTGV